MQVFRHRIQTKLAERKKLGLTRSMIALDGNQRNRFSYQGNQYVNFSSNDYLGLASDKTLANHWQEGIARYGVGSAASPLVTGFAQAHFDLKQALCEWLGYSNAVLFSSGFSANQALLFTLLEKDDVLLQDRLNHASLMEAGSLSSATMKRFRHNDIAHLEKLLEPLNSALVVTEGVFSMDGDLAPLSDMERVCQPQSAMLMVDDAHGVGVLGEDGQGSCHRAGVSPDILVVTFGKAFGLSGAAVLCDDEMADYLTQFARHHVYSTAIPPSQAYALQKSLQMIQNEPWRREKLSELSSIYHSALKDLPGYVHTETPIKPVIIGDSAKAVEVANQLRQQGHWVSAIRPPTVPKGSARLRITLTASHSPEQVSQLAHSVKHALEGVEV
ncbi:8-amino-7-oxononanoate synthase [Vibrio sp. SCSIO 43136]|uniref:8-amino-7-oxononanoate synthase n=1 Tax=Vibrio sp. SCSIO 43136 TaxID=2819101 RepID=UPI002074F9AD|nr:8-amino-7-oxononanoate synthase [Vibrio sp. SCSIO 43136]USD64374.1 8-amino-7-oxononanoate synthase [Vibrio sp. SCSIO 43136]